MNYTVDYLLFIIIGYFHLTYYTSIKKISQIKLLTCVFEDVKIKVISKKEGIFVMEWNTVYLNLARDCQRRGQWERAIEYAQKNAEIGKEIGDLKLIMQSYIIIGLSYDRMEEYDKAISFYKQSLEIMEKIEEGFGKQDIYHIIGQLYERKGNIKDARYYYKKSKLMEQSGSN
jgi:tetratricopeptide (TPR) repeat protein